MPFRHSESDGCNNGINGAAWTGASKMNAATLHLRQEKIMKTWTWAILAAALAFVSAIQGQELVLVEAGVSRAPVVVFENAPPKTLRAARELAEYIEKTSGAKPEVIEGLPDPMPESAVWVGYQPVLEELFPGLDFDFQHPEEILIAASERHLVVAGRDRWLPDHLAVELRHSTVEGVQTEYGTVNAVYTFLQDHLDVRWLWPGEMGVDIVETDTISFAPFEHRYHPQFRQRADVFRLSSLGHRRGGLGGRSHTWTRMQRLQLDSFSAPGGHAFTTWWDRFSETHPEYFALQPDGTRSGFPSASRVKLCQSNPAVWPRWLADVEAQIEQRPHRSVFNAAPNDSAGSGICVCANCLALDHPGAARRNYYWEGVTQEHVMMTDRYLKFTNRLARLLRERFPEQDDYWVGQFAYAASKTPPVDTPVEDNVVIGYVGHFPFATDEMREEEQREWAEWAEVAPAMVYRPNLWYYTVGGIWGLPEVAMTRTAEDFRFLAEHRCIGLFIDTTREHWATQAPQYYLMAQLAWNPRVDKDEVLGDFYRRAFGPAEREMTAYWDMMEQAFERSIVLPGFRFGSRFVIDNAHRARREVYTDKWLAEAEGLLDRAEERVAGAPEVYGERIGFVRVGFDFTRLVFESMSILEDAREGDADAIEQLKANRAEMARILREHPQALQDRLDMAGARGLGWLDVEN